MEEERSQKSSSSSNSNSKYDPSWSSTMNWTIVAGSPENSITFESSCSPTAADDDVQNTQKNTKVKYPLILYSNSSDPAPCETTITFAQKHEVRQVYVRSTARVFEIYYASDLSSSNEYLCTVHCGIATRDEEVLCTPSMEEAVVHLTEGSKELRQNKNESDSNLDTDEDSWVEVKAVDSSQLDNRNSPLPSNFDTKHGESIQDLYEATAEINYADPCMSITLRMLSFQNKGCVFVDEIYVFGDPVEPSDSENKVGKVENSTGSSLMAMFMPPLLELSKARRASRIGGDLAFDTKEKQKSHKIGSKATDSINVSNKMKQGGDSGLDDEPEEKLQETVGSASIQAHTESKLPPQVCNTNVPDNHIEKVLDQLVSRVSTIEDLFLRFEEHVLKHINSIDARLQRVEQQLEELNMKPWNSEFRCCTRMLAPEFSWHESDENLFNNNENNETVAPSGHEVVTEDMKSIEVSDKMNNTSGDEEFKKGNGFLENRTDGFDTSQEGSILNSKSSSIAEVTKEPSNKDLLQVLKLSHSSSVVDFETSILDVKFTSLENFNIKSPFEALWDDIPESKVEVPCTKENDDNFQIGQQQNLILVEDLDPISPANCNRFSIDMNYCSLTETPLYAEGEKLSDYYMSCSRNACEASLI